MSDSDEEDQRFVRRRSHAQDVLAAGRVMWYLGRLPENRLVTLDRLRASCSRAVMWAVAQGLAEAGGDSDDEIRSRSGGDEVCAGAGEPWVAGVSDAGDAGAGAGAVGGYGAEVQVSGG